MPAITWEDLTKLLTNPTTAYIRNCIRRGEKRTFPNIDRIRLHCLIERTLEAAIETLAQSMDIQETVTSESRESTPEMKPLSRFAGRVPSWLWLDTSSSSPKRKERKKKKKMEEAQSKLSKLELNNAAVSENLDRANVSSLSTNIGLIDELLAKSEKEVTPPGAVDTQPSMKIDDLAMENSSDDSRLGIC